MDKIHYRERRRKEWTIILQTSKTDISLLGFLDLKGTAFPP